MIVEDIIGACEYIGCDVLTFDGRNIEVTEENHNEIYKYSVEHLSAKDNIVLIWTFIDMDKYIDELKSE